MKIEIEYPLGYANSGEILYFVTPAILLKHRSADELELHLRAA